MPVDVPMDAVGADLRRALDSLPPGESVRLLDAAGEPVAVVLPACRLSGRKVTWEEWKREWMALAEKVSQAWKSDRTALETLAEMRR